MIDPKGTPWWKVILAGAAVVGTSVATGAVMMVAIAGKPAFLEVHSAPLPHGACPCSVLLSRPLERGRCCCSDTSTQFATSTQCVELTADWGRGDWSVHPSTTSCSEPSEIPSWPRETLRPHRLAELTVLTSFLRVAPVFCRRTCRPRRRRPRRPLFAPGVSRTSP